MLVFCTLAAMWFFPKYWLLVLLVLLSAGYGFAADGMQGAAANALVAVIGGAIIMIVRRTVKSAWQVERDRWDARDSADREH